MKKQVAWHNQSIDDVLDALQTSEDGLLDEEVISRRKEYGKNALPEHHKMQWWELFFRQFANPLMIILVVAAGASFVLQEWLDVFVIWAAILLNVILGFFEEYKADQSLQALQSFLPQEIRVRRNGQEKTIVSEEVVVGDIVLIASGDKVTADGRLIHANALEINESALTGESLPVKKEIDPMHIDAGVSDQASMVFAGTIVVAGNAEFVVTSVGMGTQIGHVTGLVQEVVDEKTPLQQQLDLFAKILSIAVLALATGVFFIGILQGFAIAEMFQIAVALSVSAIPEGLVVGMTVILAIGMQRILKRDALVRRLVASETLGSVSIICMDKTGTLTTGEMSVVEVHAKDVELLSKGVYLTVDIHEVETTSGDVEMVGTPTEIGLLKWVLEQKVGEKCACDVQSKLPFSSAVKFSAAYAICEGKHQLFAVGAPDVLLRRCDISDIEQKKEHEKIEQMTKEGLRVLMVVRRAYEPKKQAIIERDVRDMKPVGYLGMKDPLRSEAKSSIAHARKAGLVPIMITGDHPGTALSIAKEADLIGDDFGILTGDELEVMTDLELKQAVGRTSVYARVLPRHKLRIVRAWQEKGHAVAMTGDGVNDAPAIKAADIGIAFGSGTEVAKETADMVLLKNNFSTIVAAIREGRVIFENIRKLVVYLLADSFSEIVLVLGAIIFGLPLPILPAQILWINLITDGFPAVALTFEKGEAGIMDEPPRKKNEKILNREMIVLIFIVGLITDVLLFVVYFYLLNQDYPINEIRTFVFVKLGLDSLIYIFAIRKFRRSAFTSNPFENKWLILAVLGGGVLQVLPLVFEPLRNLFGFVALTPMEWGTVLSLSTLNFVLIEIVKFIFNRTKKK